ncbi:hypothetical protein BDQ12DRAFT_655175 [Crucibulum laeve]|uniref:Fungal-type protein kinase domain-containing protein n=1 Tax=Crucibulum laeve TaxID=68775 RepID=A0A5C3LRW4_9AGAR|nr:hypothetical protein BDQ12DRAFT_655175 [Crucibulum laeve]
MQIRAENESFDSSNLNIIHVVRDLRNLTINPPSFDDSSGTIQTLSTSTPEINHPTPFILTPSRYPTHIYETASHLSGHTDPWDFYTLWWQILSYWFPAIEGYIIQQNWETPDHGEALSGQFPSMLLEQVTFAVLYAGQPLVLLQIRGTLDSTDSTRRLAREAARQQFDRAALWSGHPTLCVISAMGKRWNAFARPTDMTSEEAEATLGYDWFGEWTENVVSTSSYEILGACFRMLKVAGERFLVF